MALRVAWCDEWVRLSPLEGTAIDGEGEAGQAPPVRLAAGRNGFASCQILVGPLGRADAVTVAGKHLTGPDKRRLAPSQWDVYVQWYHHENGAWYPDALIPQAVTGGSTPDLRRDNGVRGQKYAGFWLDLFVPADQQPGDYAGKVTVQAGSESIDLPVELSVAPAVIPTESCLDVSMNNYADSIPGAWPDVAGDPNRHLKARYRQIERNVFRACHEHRAFLHYLPYTHAGYVHGDFAPPLTGEGEKRRVTSWTDWDRHFGPYFDGSAFRGTRRGPVPVKRFWLPLNLCWPADFLKWGQPGYAAEWRAVGRQMAEHFKKKGWTKTSFDMFLNHKQRFRFFPWDCEEARFLPDQDVHRYVRTFWEGTFDWASAKPVKFAYTLGTTWTYGIDIQSDLAEFIDVFIAGTGGPAWYPEHLPRLHERGAEVWSCTHCGSIPDPARATAYTPLMIWMRDLDGFMPRWLTMGAWGADPWRHTGDRGATTFLYPGARFGTDDTYVSMRLKVLRNALQIIEGFDAAAKSATGGAAGVKDRVNEVLGFTTASWYPKRPGYVDQKPPKDWVGADFATEEPPLAGWEGIPTTTWRQLQRMALDLMAGR